MTNQLNNPVHERYVYHVNLISDTTMKDIATEFVIFSRCNQTDFSLGRNTIQQFLMLIRDVPFSDLGLEKFQELFTGEIDKDRHHNASKALRAFFAYILTHNLWHSNHSEAYENFIANDTYRKFTTDVFFSDAFIPAKYLASFFESYIQSEPFCFDCIKTELDLCNIKDNDLRLVTKHFVEFLKINKIEQPNRVLHPMLISFENIKLSELTPDKFKDIVFQALEKNREHGRALRIFLGYLINHTDYSDRYPNHFEDFNLYTEYADYLIYQEKYSIESFTKFISLFADCEPLSLRRYGTKNVWQVTKLNTSNPLLINLLDEAFKYHSGANKADERFYELFTESCSMVASVKSISDFNYSMFEEQFNFFNAISKKCIKHLIFFYLMILDKEDGTNIFKIGDPIDKNMLMRADFSALYTDGYKLVHLNRYEPCPTIDKWVLNPNVYISTSTRARSQRYYAMNYNNIENPLYKDLAKKFFWQRDVSVHTSATLTVTVLAASLNYISNIKEMYIDAAGGNIVYEHILGNDIYNLTAHLKTISNNSSTYKSYITILKDFLRYCKENNLLIVDNVCFSYLKYSGKKKKTGGEKVPNDILFNLQSSMLDTLDDSYENLLYFAIFHLLVETDIRPSQLLSLEISQIEETMKKGQFMIRSISKTSKGQVVTAHISSYAHRYLERVISHTQALRDECLDDDLKEKIFLTRNKQKLRNQIHVISIGSFNYYLKGHCEKISIKPFTTGNLRDTHMTLAREYIKKNNLSQMHEKILTGHKSVSTTNSHYIDRDIKTYIEATHSIIIGDVDLKGEVHGCNNTTYDRSAEVEQGCGYCSKDCCDIPEPLVGCLLCDGFKTYLDKIPYFESCINQLDNSIAQAQFEHDKQHLNSLKRLYCAYLAKLYTLKENQNA